MPVAKVMRAAISSTRPSTAGISAMGNEIGTRRTSKGSAARAISSPSRPPGVDTIRLSVNIWRIRRSRPAPNAARTASSRRRSNERAISRFARLAQAMRRTHKDAPSSTLSISWLRAGMSLRKAMAAIPMSAISLG